MNRRIYLIAIFIILAFFVFIERALSWEPDPTHKVLSLYAARNSVLSETKGNYLKNIGFEDGIKEPLKWGDKTEEVEWWLQEGSKSEDAGNIFQVVTGNGRFMNHFHNPLKEWETAGLDDWVIFLHYTGESSVLWAQNGDNQLNFPEGNWLWQQIKDYYYLALTSETEEERQENFAKTFRGLGHQMHLIQDAAVPAHVRNDAHPFEYNRMMGLHIEKWAAKEKNINYINSLAGNPKEPAVELNTSYQTFAPITQFIDTIGANKYNGSNPSTSLSIGLAEYANANFFSDDTIFTEDYSTDHRHYFPYPKKSSTNLQDYLAQTPLPETRMAQDGVEDLVLPHIIKNNDGENINHFVRPGYYTNHYSGEGDATYYRTFYIDEQCHEDYAAKLIPRAVGYSAGLLDYFFRGDIDMVPDEENGDGYIIKNNSDEDLEGTFRLYYDNESEERIQIESGAFPLEISIPSNNKSSNINFTIPADSKEPGKYILVFKGKLGNEEDAVIGKVVNLSLPYVVVGIGGIVGEPELCIIWNVKSNTKATDLFAQYPVLYSEFANLWKDKMPLSPGGRMFNKTFAGETSLYQGEGDPTSVNTGCELLTNEYTDNGQVDVCRYIVEYCGSWCNEDCLTCAECDSMSEFCSSLPSDPYLAAWREIMEEGVMKAFQHALLASFNLEVISPTEGTVPIGGSGETTCVRNELKWTHGEFVWWDGTHPTWPGNCSLPQQSVTAYDVNYNGYDHRSIWKTPLGDFDEVHTWSRSRHWSFDYFGTVDGGHESESFRYGTTFVTGTYSSNVYVQVYGFLGTKAMTTTTTAGGTVTSYKGEGDVKAAVVYYPEGVADISPLSQEINADFTDAIQELIDEYKGRYDDGSNSNDIPFVVEIRQLQIEGGL